jgi:hypothetical protein
MRLMASEDARLPKRWTYFELRRLGSGFIQDLVSNLGISEVNQGKRVSSSLAGNRNYFRRRKLCLLKAPSRRKSWSKWV